MRQQRSHLVPTRRAWMFAFVAAAAIAISAGNLAAEPAEAARPRAPRLDPTSQSFVEAVAKSGGPPIYTLSPSDARAVLSKAQSGDIAKPSARIEDRVLPVGPTGKTSVRIVRPEGVDGPLPAVLYFHGGGWVLGGPDTHDRLVREIAVGARAAVVFVDYDRSPEAKHPTAIEQGFAALKFVAERGQELGLDSSRLAVAGDSAGGQMAAVVALLAKERGGPALAAQVLFYPVTDADFGTASYEQFADGPWLTRTAMKWFWDAYLPDAGARLDPHVSPLRATMEQLRGLPPALVITAENDVLRDEGEAYAHKLIEAGVPVTATRCLGAIHDFVMLDAVAATPGARGAVAQATSSLRRAFGTDAASLKPAIVLVHGAFADASGWSRVIALLERDGYTVIAVQNPLKSLADDIETTRRVLDAQRGPVVLVGHSYGGAVITGAAAGRKNVKALVYVAAFAPDAGEKIGDLLGRAGPAEIDTALVPDAAGFVSIDRAKFRAVFAADVPADEARVMAATQKPIAGAIFGQAVEGAAWKTVPSWYVLARGDHAIAPGIQRFMAERIHAAITEVEASHVAFVSQPEAVVSVIEAAARDAVK